MLRLLRLLHHKRRIYGRRMMIRAAVGGSSLFIVAFLFEGLGLSSVFLSIPAWLIAPWIALVAIFAIFSFVFTGFGIFLL